MQLHLLHSHDALCLLRNAFSLSKVLYVLGTAPYFRSSLLAVFDNLQRSLLESICNINLSDSAWTQASLPTNLGGLGIRSLAKLAPSASLASAAGCSLISSMIFLCNPPLLKVSAFHEAVQLWDANHPHPETPPSSPTAYCRKSLGFHSCHQPFQVAFGWL